MEWIDTHPEVEVQTAEYQRLLGYPSHHELEGRARDLADWARAWYRQHGSPWIYARDVVNIDSTKDTLEIEGAQFHSRLLRQRFLRSESDAAILAAVSAGPEIEREAQKLWEEEKPDEYYFLEVLGSAVVERLTAMAGARFCAWADAHETAVLAHYSPGYPGWDIAEQGRLLELFHGAHKFPGKIEALESGALRPKKSLLAVFGLTRRAGRVRRLTDVVPCENCSLPDCQYRRTLGEP